MRGKVRDHGVLPAVKGITPAYAGKSHIKKFSTGIHRDHPRVCGEKFRPPFWLNFRQGSPPRMRGKGTHRRLDSAAVRITPAYAGKSAIVGGRPCAGRDHPRVCGEKELPRMFSLSTMGSPPRMRGKAGGSLILNVILGITPAYAGKRYTSMTSSPCCWDHPRVCGEKTAALHVLHLAMGSPPRMRGKELDFAGGADQPRITPAYAGKS